jgi:hypothetical protein
MRTLASELGAVLGRRPGPPRIYADANVPAGIVAFMRQALGWDVFFVVEDEDLRRAPDTEHYRRARAMSRTLITLDRDYFDDRLFPPGDSGGVIVVSAPDERQLARLLRRLDHHVWRSAPSPSLLPLAGQKLDAHSAWLPADSSP